MPLYRCNTCGGTYRDADSQGVSYFHVCPPLSDAEFSAFDPMTQAALYPGVTLPVDPVARLQYAHDHPAARPNARNENVPPGFQHPPRTADDTTPLDAAPMISDGLGRTVLA